MVRCFSGGPWEYYWENFAGGESHQTYPQLIQNHPKLLLDGKKTSLVWGMVTIPKVITIGIFGGMGAPFFVMAGL